MKRAVLETLDHILEGMYELHHNLEFSGDVESADELKHLRYRLMYVNEYLERIYNKRRNA